LRIFFSFVLLNLTLTTTTKKVTQAVTFMATMENNSWASAIPHKQGLYDPEFEKDACGVGFIVHVKGVRSHKILSDANDVLCNMTHRGASGADIRDGDGSGIMTGNL
jgi:glutamate synthase (NADPH/NADH)